MSEEAVYELWESDADAFGETLGSRYIRMRPNPDTTTVFEEFIHVAQFRSGEFNRVLGELGKDRGMVKLEIEAQEKLLRNAAKWGIPAEEVGRIRSRLISLRSTERNRDKKGG